MVVVKWCFFFFSLFRIDTGAVDVGGEAVVPAGFDGPAGDGDNKDKGNSTCAVYGESHITSDIFQ